MKKFYIAISILIALNVIITSAFVAFMPEEVPVHIGFSGEVDRIGSKYESFILPLLSLVFGGFLLLLAKHGEADNERVLLRANIALQFFMIAFSVLSPALISNNFVRKPGFANIRPNSRPSRAIATGAVFSP